MTIDEAIELLGQIEPGTINDRWSEAAATVASAYRSAQTVMESQRLHIRRLEGALAQIGTTVTFAKAWTYTAE